MLTLHSVIKLTAPFHNFLFLMKLFLIQLRFFLQGRLHYFRRWIEDRGKGKRRHGKMIVNCYPPKIRHLSLTLNIVWDSIKLSKTWQVLPYLERLECCLNFSPHFSCINIPPNSLLCTFQLDQLTHTKWHV